MFTRGCDDTGLVASLTADELRCYNDPDPGIEDVEVSERSTLTLR